MAFHSFREKAILVGKSTYISSWWRRRRSDLETFIDFDLLPIVAMRGESPIFVADLEQNDLPNLARLTPPDQCRAGWRVLNRHDLDLVVGNTRRRIDRADECPYLPRWNVPITFLVVGARRTTRCTSIARHERIIITGLIRIPFAINRPGTGQSESPDCLGRTFCRRGPPHDEVGSGLPDGPGPVSETERYTRGTGVVTPLDIWPALTRWMWAGVRCAPAVPVVSGAVGTLGRVCFVRSGRPW